ncbi:MAG: DUF2188 domain-containing protein [Bacteroidota bacterium]|nr:DUF2188 domain-containing protein [Bacteroidota bacterium]
METYHLVTSKGGWLLEKEGEKRGIKFFATKREAMEFSTKYVKEKGGSLKVHKEDGRFEEERTYPRNSDPVYSKG